MQTGYQNFAWQNTTTGVIYANGAGVTNVNTLGPGHYVITASAPYNSSCPAISHSDTFEILEALPEFQFLPAQACPDLCNVAVSVSMSVAVPGISYSSTFDNNSAAILPFTIDNQCGGMHSYEIFADGIGCGVEYIGISEFAPMNLSINSNNATCAQPGDATVSIASLSLIHI